ncbi:ThiF family adenylyltransferase [Cytobacillus oceanisediminis]|uniref:ThiF family adenylyltransferase n=1 Tax=Cytobacillus oceanisediminis TaxID=665099 RepID=UPI0020405B67|nr:ThiF family adenylyltransferase [Cytobacillus oceanisediminis]MCM3393720.1 ThiF family adenylyltransferase [Cytobacillus oceanisediminis]
MEISLELIRKQIFEMDQSLIKSFTPKVDFDKEKYSNYKAMADIEVPICGEPKTITVGFPKRFPNVLPSFYDFENHFGPIPHKLSDGFLCFTRSDSLIIDTRHPSSVVLNCLEKVINLIESGITGENQKDYMDEFEIYWLRKSILDIYAHINTSNENVRELNLWSKKTPNGEDFFIVASEKKDNIEDIIKRIFHIDISDAIKYRCFYLPIKEGAFLIPPIDEKWSFSELKTNIMSNLTGENLKAFNRLVNKPVKSTSLEYIIAGLPTPKGNVALFGFAMNGNKILLKSHKKNKQTQKQLHPFIFNPKDTSVYNAKIHRWHPNHLIGRAGGTTYLKDKHILIVGVGSIGSEIALRFAKAGVGKISLVDYDQLEFGNIHRHVLGSDQIYFSIDELALENKLKVWGMKEEINRKYPFTSVEAYPKNILTFSEEFNMNKSNVDLIIVSIGSPNTEMELNRILHGLTEPPPTLYTWVEPLGIGGHTLVTLNGDRKGCYQCLFQPDEINPIFNRAAFAQPFQEFSKSITGCGSAFVPYSFLDSERSAILTVEAGIKILLGKLQGNPLLSWKGDCALFEEYGYKTTFRYSFEPEKLDDTKYLYQDLKCPVCSLEGRD